jgi:small-conductance mechanosensitive channel
MGFIISYVELAVVLALLIVILRRLGGLPMHVSIVARRERAEDAAAAQTILQEAAAAKVGALVTALRSYNEQIATDFREQVATANLRARVAERRAAEVSGVLTTATELLREVRAMHDVLAEQLLLVATPVEARGRAPSAGATAAASELDEHEKARTP